MATERVTHMATRKRRIVLAPGLAVAQAALMLTTIAPTDVRNAVYGCSALCGTGTGAQDLSAHIATILGVLMMLLPLGIGAASRTWMAGVSWTMAPWMLAMIMRSQNVLTPYVGLGQTGGRFDLPFWMNPPQTNMLVTSGILFVGLGWLGWVMRRAWEQQDG